MTGNRVKVESAVFHNILVPTDLSGHTARAVDMARDMGRAAGARITLFHVIETLSGANYEEFGSFYRELEGRASSHLTSLASRFEGSGLEVAKPSSMASRPKRSSGSLWTIRSISSCWRPTRLICRAPVTAGAP